ncbi:hypothetical protein [Nocardia inohanensis]|uniref:hypothetical protein n=1 Tax=Nocardia inohanensis TaxID=209246 RepID=UPI00082C5C56|nr:hypothetical protein [Nocardia inohanensis]
MKKLVAVAAITAGLMGSAGVASAETVAAPSHAAPIATGSSSADIFCAVIQFLKGGWAGRTTDCSF